MLVLLPAEKSEAQFLRIVMEVEPELSAQTLQPLDFGQLYQNAGPIEVNMGENNMGIFTVMGYPNQSVRVSLHSPELLRHADRSFSDSLNISIRAAYANRGVNRIEDARLFNGNTAQFQMMESTGGLTPTQMMQNATAYIFIFGSISVGDVQPGHYDGMVVMEVEYL